MVKSNGLIGIALFSLALGIFFLNENVLSQQTADNGMTKANVGRDNPFAKLDEKELASVMPTVSEIVRDEELNSMLFVQTVVLKFLDAKSLKQAIDNMSSARGSIAINEKNNSVIICDTKDNLVRIVSEIRKADATPRQIMIEVVILDVQLNDENEMGVNWDILSDKRYDIGYRQNFTTSRIGSTPETSTTIGDATAFNSTGLGGSFSVISGTIRNVVHLIQQEREVEILASPRVMMVSGESASIEAVEELPYTEVIDTAAGGAAALTSTKFKNVGVQLNVVATLTDDDNILLTVDTEQNVATGESDTEIPIVDTRRANTSLILKDGQVVILGGLRRQEKTKDVNQIPILSDLPLVGILFKSTKEVVRNSELTVFLSPHIYMGEPAPDDAMSKYDEITNRPFLSLEKEKNGITGNDGAAKQKE